MVIIVKKLYYIAIIAIVMILIVNIVNVQYNDSSSNNITITYNDPNIGEYKVQYIRSDSKFSKILTKATVGSSFTLTLSQFAHTSLNDAFNAYYDDSGIYAGFYYDYLKTLYLFKIGWDGKINWSTGMKLDVQPYQIIVLSNDSVNVVSYIILLKNGSVMDIILNKNDGASVNSFMITNYNTGGSIRGSANYDEGKAFIGKLVIDVNGDSRVLTINDTDIQYVVPIDEGYVGFANINGQYGDLDVKVDVVKSSGESFSYWFGTMLRDSIHLSFTPVYYKGSVFILLDNPDNTKQLILQKINGSGLPGEIVPFTYVYRSYNDKHNLYVIDNKIVFAENYYWHTGFCCSDYTYKMYAYIGIYNNTKYTCISKYLSYVYTPSKTYKYMYSQVFYRPNYGVVVTIEWNSIYVINIG